MPSNIAGQGHIIEAELLGTVKKEKYERSDHPNVEAYLDFGQSIDLVKRTQPSENPTLPEAPFAADLRRAVSKKLASLPNNFAYDPKNLEYYTAVKSHLDQWHSIDAFLEYLDRQTGKKTRALIDLTIDPTKSIDPAFAGQIVLILAPGDGLDKQIEGDRIIWNKLIEEASDEIVQQLLQGQEIK
ncbi:MAG TPA: hypothetical protein VMC41_01810 [Candidatus Nanoarchaeia archaeon]|nr:hypothetical protein [Candidatus Nanoarchaeia archaeon]